MVKEIRIYIEGGGDGKNTKALIRKGFSQFFKQFKLNITICGSRNNAFRDFRNALKSYPNAFNILLVDAEAPVTINSPWGHLKFRDNWDKPSEVDDNQCHLMVQTMEAWFIADIETLKQFYGKDFLENAIPKTLNVETINKQNLERSLKAATRNTSKGEYHKIKHASKLLELLDVNKVRQASPSCDLLLKTLSDKITKV
ncbi:DUF4276 family protein [Nodularia sphaerocarpa]|uniref:DUF4276 family protein n=1 Tax=Nodularia sphaerocarpa TaxID=137816 RepID=UPI001EFA6318|nr:DUF4276 family protein [Nodularia sphaerocarpa]MDB9374638.1 DUF4276 family protein [Nodularia sphaerocarpa CS-585]MDB9380001.1 DUF4276 family protein [Nodularia sphaerocarpa CS-585A2]ULP74872.1 hypothetical protein BDGGKGIB_04543 [Nodularia sphaerocarpa UHCC 0038]